jgi:hypothetical protein
VHLLLTVLRPEDFLLLRLEFRDVDFTPPSVGQAGEVRGAANACLIVEFPPQHIAEQAFYELTPAFKPSEAEEKARGPAGTEPDPLLRPGAVQSRLAGPSRLVFDVPPGEAFPYSLQAILDALPRLPLRVSPISAFEPNRTGCSPLDWLLLRFRAPPPPQITKPEETHTAIEAPHRLMMSPDGFGTWSHQPGPVTHDDRTELWHTRLGTRRGPGLPMRAIWSPDWHPSTLQNHFLPASPTDADPFRASLDARDRNEIVHLTSNYHVDRFMPTPVETDALMLSSLGGWLKVRGDWDPPKLPRGSLTVEQWHHDAAIGRDQAVRVVYAGFLLPFGHRASLVKVTERKFVFASVRSQGIAYLRQRMFLIVREPVRQFTHRSLPFTRVHLLTQVTPDLLPPTTDSVGTHGQSAFWPLIPGPGGPQDPVDFLFHLTATDHESRAVEFTAPLMFVDKNVDETSAGASAAVNAYNGQSGRRLRSLNGQPVALAPPSKPRDTTFNAASMTFGAEKLTSGEPHFRPTMTAANLDIPAVSQVTGKPAPSEVAFEKSYLTGSGKTIGNAGHVFARVKSRPLDFGTTDRSGGLVAPNLDITGLSRELGPIADVDQLVSGAFNPKQVFAGVKLLGAVSLGEIVKDMTFNAATNALNRVPRLVTVRDGDVLRTTYTWSLGKEELVDIQLFTPNPGAALTLKATVEKKLDGGLPETYIEGALTNFSITLLPKKTSEPDSDPRLVELQFQAVRFKARPNAKVDVSVEFGGLKFLGILEFVNELQKWIPFDGFSDPPDVRLVGDPVPGVDVGFTLGIPDIGIGIMTMQNISLGASAYLPFGKAPMNFRFAFCERHQPFTLTVSLFGGGGFFAMNVGLDKVVMIEAALEFGASAAINLGVAKGQVSIMAGFYFQKAGQAFELTGYFRASGSLSVLGIISISLVFYLGLSYASKPSPSGVSRLWGQASLTVKIEVLFFSKSVSVKMEREFAGSDPKFHELVSPAAWAEYCEGFAEYA